MVTEEEGKTSKDKPKEGETNNYHASGRENSLPPKHSKPVARPAKHTTANTTSNNKPVTEQKREESLQKRGRMQEEIVSSNQHTGTGSNASEGNNQATQQQSLPQQSRTGHQRSSSREHPISQHFFGYGQPPHGYPPEMFPVHGGHYPPRGYAPPVPWMPHHHGHGHPSGEDYQGGSKPFHPYPDFGGRMAYPPRPPLNNIYGENYHSSRGGNQGWQGDR